MNKYRTSRRTTSKRLSRIGVIVAVAIGTAAACAPESANWSPAQSAKRNDVRWISFEHTVVFKPGSDILSDAERVRLDRFIALHDAGYGDQILIGTNGRHVRPSDATHAARREAAVSAVLREREFAPHLMPALPSNRDWDGSVLLTLSRYVVVPPDCPDWSKAADADPNNRVSSNFGCATATNLGLMVANPGDLVRGRPGGPADGAAGARLYRTYRDGEQKQGPAITPLVIQSGTGAGG